jgi:LPS-assembly lipoprotein
MDISAGYFSQLSTNVRGCARTLPRRIAVLVVVATLAGCGFHPLYGRSSGNAQIAPEMASIYIEPIADRQGQLLRNALLGRMSSEGQAHYRLEVKLTTTETQVLLQPDQTSAINGIGYQADFTLFEGTTALTKGSISRSFSFDFLNQQYSNVSALNSIERRAAEEIATQISDVLATYFVRAERARKAAAAQAPAAPSPNP